MVCTPITHHARNRRNTPHCVSRGRPQSVRPALISTLPLQPRGTKLGPRASVQSAAGPALIFRGTGSSFLCLQCLGTPPVRWTHLSQLSWTMGPAPFQGEARWSHMWSHMWSQGGLGWLTAEHEGVSALSLPAIDRPMWTLRMELVSSSLDQEQSPRGHSFAV